MLSYSFSPDGSVVFITVEPVKEAWFLKGMAVTLSDGC